METLLAGRSLQGIGGGGILVLTEIIVTDLVPLRHRGKWFGYISVVWAIGTVLGPVTGGIFTEKVSWRWVFWINLPVCGIGFIMIPIFLQLNYQTCSLLAKLKKVDWFGAVLFIVSLTSFLVPITWGGVQYAWNAWQTLLPLFLGAAGLIGFIFYEKYVAAEPLMRLSIFNNPTAVTTYVGTVMHGMVLWSLLYYLPLYYEVVKGLSPTISGLALFPQTFTVAPASILAGILITKTGRYRWAIWSGWVFTMFGMGLLYLLDVHTSTGQWICLNTVVGFGAGVLFLAMSSAIQVSASYGDTAFAAAMYSFFTACGQGLGVAVGGVIFQNELRRRMISYPLLAPAAEIYSKDSTALVETIKHMPLDLPERALLIQSYADALKMVWIVMCALSFVALLVSFWTKGLSLDVELATEQGFKHCEKVCDEEKQLSQN